MVENGVIKIYKFRSGKQSGQIRRYELDLRLEWGEIDQEEKELICTILNNHFDRKMSGK